MIVAMLSFFEETRATLDRALEGVAALGCSTVIAVDGAYALFPGARPRSSPARIADLSDLASLHRLELVLLQPRAVWAGNEVEKRAVMLEDALALTEPDDWLLIWDADYELDRCDIDLASELRLAAADFASVSFADDPSPEPSWHPARLLMRARRDLRMGSNHYTYYTDAGRSDILVRAPTMPALSLEDSVFVRHRVRDRDPERRALQTEYYQRRDEGGIEQ